MTVINRELLDRIDSQTSAKAFVLYGPHGVGKTSMLRRLSDGSPVAWFNGYNPQDFDRLTLRSATDVNHILQLAKTLVIDEAQRIPNIRLTLKQLVDANEMRVRPTKILVAASSSLDLARGTPESAVGRLTYRHLWPFSLHEAAQAKSRILTQNLIDERLIFGMFPQVCLNPSKSQEILMRYVETVLLNELFALGGIQNQNGFLDLLRILALRIGSVVSYTALADETGLSEKTVQSYIRLLEQCFIIKVCRPFANNLKDMMRWEKKIYFCDNGIRNALINKFDPLSGRSDAGALWENFFFMERFKLHSIRQDFTDIYFCRTVENKPHKPDFIEEIDGQTRAFHCATSDDNHANPDATLLKAYPNCPVETVRTRDLMRLWKEAL